MPRMPKLPPGIRGVVKDRLGRLVELTEERWTHIVAGHPAMDGLELMVKTAVETADTRLPGTLDNVERLFARNLGPAKWLVVVVAYERQRGTILTAYPQTKDPKPESEGAE